MPVYEYECTACGEAWEETQGISDRPKRKCPLCGKHKARRLISQSTFILRGDGWYSSGYASSKPEKP